MNYSSYLGSQKCNNVVCRQGEIGPRGLRGLIGPTGPYGPPLNSFTIISSNAVYLNNTIIWNMDIPFVYGKQFIFTFHTNNTTVDPLPTGNQVLDTTYNYIFGTGQSVYQPYILIVNSNPTIYYGYIPSIISIIGDKNTSSTFEITASIDTINLKVNYQFIYNNVTPDIYSHFSNSTIQLDGTKC